MNKLTALYEAILASMCIRPTEEGFLYLDTDDDKKACFSEGKRITLPRDNILRTPNWNDTLMAYHPLSENVLRGESPILQFTRTSAIARLSEVIMMGMLELLYVAADTDSHKRLTPKQKEFLASVPEVDEKTVKTFSQIIERFDVTGNNRIINIYLKQGGVLGNKTYHRTAMVSFPVLEKLEKETVEIGEGGKPKKVYELFGVPLRKKDKESILGLFNWLLPAAGEANHYSYGSDSFSSPYYHSLLNGYANVAKALNKKLDGFKKVFEYPERLHIDLSWLDDIADLTVFRDMLPTPLPGNDGPPLAGEKEEAKAAVLAPATATAAHAAKAPLAPPKMNTAWSNAAPSTVAPAAVPTAPTASGVPKAPLISSSPTAPVNPFNRVPAVPGAPAPDSQDDWTLAVMRHEASRMAAPAPFGVMAPQQQFFTQPQPFQPQVAQSPFAYQVAGQQTQVQSGYQRQEMITSI